jgi:hypothetical protein
MQALQKFMLVLLILAALLTACAPAQTQEQIQSQIQTSVAMTVQAQNQVGTFVAQTVEAQSSQTTLPTATTAPTETPVAPTLTPVIISTPTSFTTSSSGGGGGGSSSTASQPYQCSVVGQTPQDNSPATILKTNDNVQLDVKWTIMNVGTKTWEAGSPWVYYATSVDSDSPADFGLTMSSVGLQSGLSAPVKPGETVTLGIQLTPPSSFSSKKPIYITTYWALVLDGVKKYCHPWINVEILRPGMNP